MANPFDAACWPEMEISYAYPTQTSAADGPTIQSRSVDTKVPRLIRLSNPTARPVVWRDVEDHAQTMQAKPWPVVLPVLGSREDGIHVGPTSTRLTKNVANANQLAGIRAVTTAIDGGGNRAQANVVVDCEGVACQ